MWFKLFSGEKRSKNNQNCRSKFLLKNWISKSDWWPEITFGQSKFDQKVRSVLQNGFAKFLWHHLKIWWKQVGEKIPPPKGPFFFLGGGGGQKIVRSCTVIYMIQRQIIIAAYFKLFEYSFPLYRRFFFTGEIFSNFIKSLLNSFWWNSSNIFS